MTAKPGAQTIILKRMKMKPNLLSRVWSIHHPYFELHMQHFKSAWAVTAFSLRAKPAIRVCIIPVKTFSGSARKFAIKQRILVSGPSDSTCYRCAVTGAMNKVRRGTPVGSSCIGGH